MTAGDDTTTPATSVRTEDITVPTTTGQIVVRLYHPAVELAEPVGLVWCHGGAYAYGDLDQLESHWVASSLAEAGISVVAVDYSLSPVPEWALQAGAPAGTGTAHYPVARIEVETVHAWAEKELTLLSPRGWALGGASAGGTLTASATMSIRDAGGTLPSRLLLAYPLVHAELPPFTPELQAALDASTEQLSIPLSPETVRLICLNYIGDDPELARDPHAFPGGHDVTGFPPTFLVHSDADTIRASGAAFAGQLAAAGVDTTSYIEKGTIHGHLDTPQVPGARRSIRRMAEWLTADLATS